MPTPSLKGSRYSPSHTPVSTNTPPYPSPTTVPPIKLQEPLLTENPGHFTLFPIADQEIWQFYKKQLACFWTAEELDLTGNAKHYQALTPQEQHFIGCTLTFFAASDGIVAENLCESFVTEVQLPEAHCFYGLQIAMENIHKETYSLLIDTLVKDREVKHHLLNGMFLMPTCQLFNQKLTGLLLGATHRLPPSLSALWPGLRLKAFSSLALSVQSSGLSNGASCQASALPMN
jgi:hypothetical protein